MADLTIEDSKYPPGKRISHPDFGDVCKTTFAKGVITDFEKIQDVPLQVKSRVKVRVGGQESDFIPLFYHPQKQYWDDPDGVVLATDYDAEGGFFKKAWMSFRGDDEVAVILKEGVPAAVIGFADGKPRIGEDIVKLNEIPGYQPALYYSMFNSMNINPIIDNSEKGPDGLPLNLTEQAKFYEGGIETRALPIQYSACGGDSNQNPDPPYNAWTDAQYVKYVSSIFMKLGLWIVIVGPILYAFLSLIQKSKYESGLYLYHSDAYEPAVNDWDLIASTPPYICTTPPIVGTLYGALTTGESAFSCAAGIVKAGIYSDTLLAATIASLGSVSALDFYDGMGGSEDLWPEAPSELIYQWAGGIIPGVEPSKIKLFFKPHNEPGV